MLRLGVAAAVVLIFCHFSPSGSTACLPSFPLPERSSTAVFCVDANGCCNFTTVQAAVDAIPPDSEKRNVVWINSGIYM